MTLKIKNRQDFLVVLTIAVVVLAVAVNFIFPPILGWWSDRQKEIKDLQAKISDGNGLIRREAAVRSHWAEMQRNALPPNTSPAGMSPAEQQFLTALNTWSRESGAEITSTTPQWKNESTNYSTLNCRVEAAGDLGVLSRFIYNIEKGPLMVRLDSVELSTHDNNGQQLTLGLEIDALALQNNKK